MGGRVAQDMSAHHADRADAVVLAASAAKPNPLNVYSLRAGAYLYRQFGSEAAAAFGPLISFTHRYFENHLDSLTDDLGAPAAHPMALHAYEGHARAIERHDATPLLGRIAAPTLVLMGDQEWLNPISDAGIMVAGIANARLQVLGRRPRLPVGNPRGLQPRRAGVRRGESAVRPRSTRSQAITPPDIIAAPPIRKIGT